MRFHFFLYFLFFFYLNLFILKTKRMIKKFITFREDGGREENCIPSFNILIVMGSVEGIRTKSALFGRKSE